MTQDAKNPDVSYVTEPQRRWIGRTYGADWDKLQVRVVDPVQWIAISLDEPISASELIGKITNLVESIPERHRHSSVFKASCDGYGDCLLSFMYTRLETERDFNQRIAGYLHRWERLRDLHIKDGALFEMG